MEIKRHSSIRDKALWWLSNPSASQAQLADLGLMRRYRKWGERDWHWTPSGNAVLRVVRAVRDEAKKVAAE